MCTILATRPPWPNCRTCSIARCHTRLSGSQRPPAALTFSPLDQLPRTRLARLQFRSRAHRSPPSRIAPATRRRAACRVHGQCATGRLAKTSANSRRARSEPRRGHHHDPHARAQQAPDGGRQPGRQAVVQCPGIAHAKRGRGCHSERSPAACASLCCGAQRGISCRSMGRRSEQERRPSL
jgi:hypothetical protein